jgi:uncharacterized protein
MSRDSKASCVRTSSRRSDVVERGLEGRRAGVPIVTRVGKVLNFHLPAENVERAATFYRQVFGWEITPFPDSPAPYLLIKSGPAETPGIEGAIMERNHTIKHPTPTIEVESIDDAMARLSMLGGQSSSVRDIPGVGRFGYAYDSEGNLIALLQRTATR